MAKKLANTTKEESISTKEQEIKTEPLKKYIISNSLIQMRKKPDLLSTSVVGQMKIGTAYEIIGEVSNIYGGFYKLDNELYVTKNSNYTIC